MKEFSNHHTNFKNNFRWWYVDGKCSKTVFLFSSYFSSRYIYYVERKFCQYTGWDDNVDIIEDIENAIDDNAIDDINNVDDLDDIEDMYNLINENSN